MLVDMRDKNLETLLLPLQKNVSALVLVSARGQSKEESVTIILSNEQVEKMQEKLSQFPENQHRKMA